MESRDTREILDNLVSLCPLPVLKTDGLELIMTRLCWVSVAAPQKPGEAQVTKIMLLIVEDPRCCCGVGEQDSPAGPFLLLRLH